ncbi:MAG TPA: hypothetical protein DCR14_04315, partial [Acidimicrobiaceae bacterium]|nr:hypothetical protein [Acidimicrobiaceae bacterium]
MPADSPPSPAAESGLPDRALLSALEFAVGVAAAGAKLRPALPFPNGLKPYLKLNRLSAAALPTIRAVVEADPVFLRRLGLAATPELVDEVGMLWLTRPDGWQAAAADALAAAEADAAAADVAAELQREQRRRHAAEAAAARARVELVAMQESLAQTAASASSAQASVERHEGELAAARRQIRELE